MRLRGLPAIASVPLFDEVIMRLCHIQARVYRIVALRILIKSFKPRNWRKGATPFADRPFAFQELSHRDRKLLATLITNKRDLDRIRRVVSIAHLAKIERLWTHELASSYIKFLYPSNAGHEASRASRDSLRALVRSSIP